MSVEQANDWTALFAHYLDADLLSAGMPKSDWRRLFSAIDPLEKWAVLEPYWPRVQHTGYARAVTRTLRELYGIPALTRQAIPLLNERYLALIKPGFYREVLQQRGNILSCQTNRWPFLDSEDPDLVMSDLDITDLFHEPGSMMYRERCSLPAATLADWHGIIRWWFREIAPKAVAFKSSGAYRRPLDFALVPAEAVEAIYPRFVAGEPVSPAERKALEDHLFWFVLEEVRKDGKPWKFHTGYHGQWDGKKTPMDLRSLRDDMVNLSRLCALAPEVRFVFLHAAYPYFGDVLAVVKQHPNAYADLAWTWIIDPVGAREFLKRALVTVPLNKLFPFGGDFFPVELAYGHSLIARDGVALALSELVDERWLTLSEAMEVLPPLFNGNARQLYQLK
ncbi:amidohydrolase family protein [Nibricoccus sp. IMCC34717]|uniref:amidohydrolase family protein n=1 Tax=Nibricoccus sp. IMCC34717 TaxID=3034021 RepID=UPI00384E04B1